MAVEMDLRTRIQMSVIIRNQTYTWFKMKIAVKLVYLVILLHRQFDCYGTSHVWLLLAVLDITHSNITIVIARKILTGNLNNCRFDAQCTIIELISSNINFQTLYYRYLQSSVKIVFYNGHWKRFHQIKFLSKFQLCNTSLYTC